VRTARRRSAVFAPETPVTDRSETIRGDPAVFRAFPTSIDPFRTTKFFCGFWAVAC